MTRRLGRYELVHRLGVGGGGEVWEGVLHGPAGFRRRVAIKLLAESSGDANLHDLLQEARLGALVAHPHVVSTLELNEHEARWFMVMELVRGCSAAQLLRHGPVPPGALLDLAEEVCAGLAHIHELTDQDGWPLGLIHRDIKPGNLMIDTRGMVRIVDLGIARLQGTAQVPAGTAGYLAPEQLRGDEGPMADLFSLGATLAHLALGRLPLGSGEMAIARVLDPDLDGQLIASGLFRALDAYLPGLGALVQRAMRADPMARWASARAMGAAAAELRKACPRSLRLAGMQIPAAGGTSVRTGGLTTERGSFVGRRREREALGTLLQDPEARWVALVGPGGVGKTRLLDEETRELDAVRADASKARTLSGFCFAVAEALEGHVGPDPVASVARLLVDVELLVIDEIEQAVDAASEAIAAWQAEVPGLRVLCSSRVAPGHPDAVIVRVGPMGMEDGRRLFSLRYGGSVSNDVLDPLLRALDRLPLAVELAAARARRTSPTRVLAQLQASSSAQVPSLRQALDASWSLLDEEDRDALVRLASFAGAFGADDAVAVLDPHRSPLERLERLVDHSMLHVRGNRFRLLTSVRAFARSKRPGVRRLGEQLHGRWFARLGHPDVIEKMEGRDELESLGLSLDDLLEAHRRALAVGDAEVAVATALAASQVLHRTGPVPEILRLVPPLLAYGLRLPELHRTLGRAHYGCGDLHKAIEQQQAAYDHAVGIDRLETAVSLESLRHRAGQVNSMSTLLDLVESLEAAGEMRAVVHARTLLGQLHYLDGRLVAADHHLTKVMELQRALGQADTHARGLHAAVLKRLGRIAESDAWMQTAAEAFAEQGNLLMEGVWSMNVASSKVLLGDLEAAERAARRAIEAGRITGRIPSVGLSFACLVEVAWERGDAEAAAASVAEAEKAAAASNDRNLACEVWMASARVAFLAGAHDDGLAHLEKIDVGATGFELESVAQAAALAARFGPPEEALQRFERLAQRVGEDEALVHTIIRVGRTEALMRAGRIAEARGALLEASVSLQALGLPLRAPLSRSWERLRAALAG